MKIREAQSTVSRVLAFGVTFTSLFLTTSGVSDPVNVTKMTVAGGVGISGLFLFLAFGYKGCKSSHLAILVTVALFLLAGCNAVIFSKAPISQNLYGTYGRNTGFFTYLFMVGILLCALMMESEQSFKFLTYGLVITGVVNVVYCAWVLAFGDFLSWSNPYGNILGLFGNPDFISAFLGMFITTSIALSLKAKESNWKRLTLLTLSILAFYEITRSHAIQGIVVTLGGLAVIGFFIVRARFSKSLFAFIYLAGVTFIGFLAILGTLQKGPFTFVYKRSVSLRGSYWHAGIDMGNQNPLHGVGFDTYGDWYRRSRPPVALVDMPGVNIMSNVSHNVVIDFFASGGWPLLLSYVTLLVLVTRSIIKVTLKIKTFDPIFVAMTATWLCYQAQSIISINQVGLTIWGWALSGALLSYEKYAINANSPESTALNKSKKPYVTKPSVLSPVVVASLGCLVGLFVASPAINAERSWQKAIQSQNLENIKQALEPTLMNPASSFKYAQAVDLLQRNNLLDIAHQFALKGTTYNSDYFDAWKQLYYLPNVTTAEKNEALMNMIRLDPLNPDVTQIR